MQVSLVLVALWMGLGPVVTALSTITVQGTQFVNSVTKKKFEVVGVAYQPGGASGYDPSIKKDPLTDADACLRDAALMQQLGINSIRVYNLNPAGDHDLCMSIFNMVGIYVLIDVNAPPDGESLSRGDPKSSYNVDYLKRIFSIVEAFKDYPNLLGFFGGNEVVNDAASANAVSPYLRAVTRDLKAYIAKHASRVIPVGYSAADDGATRIGIFAYLTCSLSGSPPIDFFGLNSYSWCGGLNFMTSGYSQLVTLFQNSTIPLFFSEVGCNKPSPRVFDEIGAIYSTQMPLWSGALVYEYSNETNNYGLVQLNSDGSIRLLKDFDNLQSKYNSIDKAILTAEASTATVTVPSCPTSFSFSSFPSTVSVPDLPDGGQDLIDNGISSPNVGKLVTVTNTKVSQKITDSNGNVLANLEIKPVAGDNGNLPSGATTSGDALSTTTSAPSSKPTKAHAEKARLVGSLGVGLVGVVMAFVLCLW